MRPGNRVAAPKSITCTVAGSAWELAGRTSRMRLPRIATSMLCRGFSAIPSMSHCARTTTVGASGVTAAGQAYATSPRSRKSVRFICSTKLEARNLFAADGLAEGAESALAVTRAGRDHQRDEMLFARVRGRPARRFAPLRQQRFAGRGILHRAAEPRIERGGGAFAPA